MDHEDLSGGEFLPEHFMKKKRTEFPGSYNDEPIQVLFYIDIAQIITLNGSGMKPV